MPQAVAPSEKITEPDAQFIQHVIRWADTQLERGDHILATSNQGTVLRYRDAQHDLVLKTAMGRGAALRTRRHTLLREYAAYRRLTDVKGIPACMGLWDQRYLVLNHVAGTPYREATLANPEQWFTALLQTLRACHERGVAHGDLKNKSNLMSTTDGQPCIIDFGMTVIRRDGFHPINRRLFPYFCQLDLNAWVKHKYQGRFEDVSDADQSLYRDSLFERLARRYRQLRGMQGAR